MHQNQFVSKSLPHWAWTVCGPVFQELNSCVIKHEPHVKFHDFDTMVEEKFLIDPGKIIILSQIGDLLEFGKFKHIFKSNLEYYKQTGKKKNFFILLTAFEYDPVEVIEFEDILKIYFVPTFYEHYNNIIKVNEYDLVDDLKFHFLSYNGRSSLLRTSLFCYFYRKSIIGSPYKCT
jgi:arginine/lysine/ornithine decarboxylase